MLEIKSGLGAKVEDTSMAMTILETIRSHCASMNEVIRYPALGAGSSSAFSYKYFWRSVSHILGVRLDLILSAHVLGQ